MSNLGKIIIVVLLIAIIITIKVNKQNDKVETPLPIAVTQTTPIPVTVTTDKSVKEQAKPIKKIEKKIDVNKNQKKTMTEDKTVKPPVLTTVTKLPRMLELGSDSCQPCKMMQPILAELRSEYAGKLQVDFIDIYQDKTAGEKYNVQFIPTQIFFDADGKEIFRHTGFYPKSKILDKFKELKITL